MCEITKVQENVVLVEDLDNINISNMYVVIRETLNKIDKLKVNG